MLSRSSKLSKYKARVASVVRKSFQARLNKISATSALLRAVEIASTKISLTHLLMNLVAFNKVVSVVSVKLSSTLRL